jgi:uncharacterized protein
MKFWHPVYFIKDREDGKMNKVDGAVKLIEEIARAIVDKPDQVWVHSVVSQSLMTLTLAVAKDDMGKIIGKKGRTITAIRTIFAAMRIQKDQRMVIMLMDD